MTREGQRTAVLALGGNALARAGEPATVTNQFRRARESVAPIVELARQGWRIVIVHGNGPQVGDELVRNEAARKVAEPLPLGVLVAETAGWIGYMLQQSLQNALAAARVQRDVITLITQTLVDRYDPALNEPTKPIGHALPAAEAARLREAGRAVGKDGAGDWRRMATSPLPLGIVEFPLIKRLLDAGTLVIAAGGGGPPVYQDPILGLEGLDAVVDKDRVSAILGSQLAAEVLMILTNVEAVFEGWGTPAGAPHPADDGRAGRGHDCQRGARRGRNETQDRSRRRVCSAGRRPGDHRSPFRGSRALRGEAGTTIVRAP